MSITPITFNLLQGSVSFNFTVEAARDLQSAIADLMTSLKAVANQTTAPGVRHVNPQKSMEYCYTGDVFLEIFCNPNIWPSPFAAKVLITVRDERIRLSTEAELTRTIEDLNQYLNQI